MLSEVRKLALLLIWNLEFGILNLESGIDRNTIYKMQTRTRRQKEVLDFITRYIDSHGYEPSYQMIARQIGVSSKAGIAKHIQALEEQGLLERRRENGSFSLVLNRQEPVAEAGSKIEWLDVAKADPNREDWEAAPFHLPQFVLGFYEPDRIFAFRVPDDAMAEKNICRGDIALIEKRSHARDGECVVVTVKKKETMLRIFFREGSKVELACSNEGDAGLRLPADQVEIHGVFRALIRPA